MLSPYWMSFKICTRFILQDKSYLVSVPTFLFLWMFIAKFLRNHALIEVCPHSVSEIYILRTNIFMLDIETFARLKRTEDSWENHVYTKICRIFPLSKVESEGIEKCHVWRPSKKAGSVKNCRHLVLDKKLLNMQAPSSQKKKKEEENGNNARKSPSLLAHVVTVVTRARKEIQSGYML